MERMHLETGTILADKYRLESVLGVGGMGTVYRAQHLALNAPVAVKVIDREVTEGDVALSRFMREAQSAASLRSPHVVQILDYGTDHDRPFMVMELLEGEPLGARIRRLGRLSPGDTFWVMHHIAKAVSKAHEADIVHRDLKPDNVFLVHNEGDEIAKVLDFGVAKVEATALDGAGHTRTGSLLGTPYYMSPEQAQGNKDVDSRSDLWALGVIAFECMTGKRPFQSDGLGDLVLQICIRDIPVPSQHASVPPAFDAWFEKACAREPSDRFQTARELAESLREALGLGGPGSAFESRWAERSLAPRLSPAAQAVRDAAEASKVPSTTEDAGAAPAPPGLGRARAEEEPGWAAVSIEDERATDTTVFDDQAPRSESGKSQWEVLPRDAPAETDLSAASAASQIEPPRSKSGKSLLVVGLSAVLIGGALVFGLRTLGFDLSQENRPASFAKPRAPVATSAPATSSSVPVRSPADSAPGAGAEPRPSAPAADPDPTAADDAETGLSDQQAGDDGTAASPDTEKAEDPGQAPGAEETKDSPREDETSLDAIEDSARKATDKKKSGPADRPKGPSPVVPETLAPTPPPPPPAQE